MPLLFIFPRLDTTSVIGDEGRPRATSLGIASVVVFGLALVGSALIGDAQFVMAMGTASATVVAGLALLERDRFMYLFVGTLMAVPIGSAMSWRLGVALFMTDAVLVGLGFSLALFGIGLTWVDLGDRDGGGTVMTRIGIGYLGLLFGGLVPMFILSGILLAAELVTGGAGSAAAFLLTISLLGGAVYMACRLLPFEQLAPRQQRADIVTQVEWAQARSGIVALAALVAIPGVWLLAITGLPAVKMVGLFATPLLMGPVMILAGAVTLVTATTWLVKWVARRQGTDTRRQVAAVCAGAFVGTFLLAIGIGMPIIIPPLLIMMLLGPLLFLAGLGAVLVAMDIGILPERGGGVALASVGLAMGTVGATLSEFPVPFVLACAAGTVIVWDVSTFGVGLTAELGHIPETRRLELVHAVVIVGLGIVAVALASLLYFLRVHGGLETGGKTAMALAALGGLIALIPLRG